MSRIRSILCIICCCSAINYVAQAASYPEGVIIDDVINTVYQGGEKLSYRISWSGGIKIGELQMETRRIEGKESEFELRATVKDSGIFHFFYPVDDTFTTRVAGKQRLPLIYDVIQKEGRDYLAKRHTKYDQLNGIIRYQKNEQVPVVYKVEGTVHNEFSSFFFTRIIHLDQNQPVIVPTFVDGKRHEVVVRTGTESRIKNTIRGDMNVLPVTPVMKFKGLYDKDGDTIIWLSNDPCRIPVRITSKILIGSLTADLVSYTNPSCKDQSKLHHWIPAKYIKKQALELGD